MADVKFFLSFEFDRDGELKNSFYDQARTLSPHRIVNSSLNEAYPDERWENKARAAINGCDLVVVLVGRDTHNAHGVKTEVEIARQLGKPVFQVVPPETTLQRIARLGRPCQVAVVADQCKSR